jgi:predicted O-methyltransferase YrrM
MNFRSQTMLQALEHLSAAYPDQPLNVIEVGCMFKEDEGLSTYYIADFLATREKGDRFISIEYDQGHIEASQAIIAKRKASLSQQIDYRHGHSLEVLPGALTEMGQVHLFCLDGGAHPEVCLVEFEQAASYLAPNGIVLVDDAQTLAPSPAYQPPRPFGKATLILPMLVLLNYLKHRAEFREANTSPADRTGIPDSDLIRQCETVRFAAIDADHFAVIGDRHKILVYGDPAFITQAAQISASGKLVQKLTQNSVSLQSASKNSNVSASNSSPLTSLTQRLAALLRGK